MSNELWRTRQPVGASPPSDLREVVDLSADAVPQHDEHRHGHLHVALLGVVAEHLLDDGAEEAGGQVRAEERLRDGDEREGLDGREAGDLGLVAADVRRVGLVLLQVVGRRRVVHDLVAQLEGLAGQQVLLLLCQAERSGGEGRRKECGAKIDDSNRHPEIITLKRCEAPTVQRKMENGQQHSSVQAKLSS